MKPYRIKVGDLVEALEDNPNISDDTNLDDGYADIIAQIERGDILKVTAVQEECLINCWQDEEEECCTYQLMEFGDILKGCCFCWCEHDFVLVARKPEKKKEDIEDSRLGQLIL